MMAGSFYEEEMSRKVLMERIGKTRGYKSLVSPSELQPLH